MASFIKFGLTRFLPSLRSPRFALICNLSLRSPQKLNGNNYLISSALKNSSVRTYSSDADREFLNVLSQELESEKQQAYSIPTFSDSWKVSRNGPECSLSNDYKNDSIKVSFNVNGSIPPFESEDEDAMDDVRSEPDFMVDVKKGANSDVLSFECYFPNYEQDSDYEEHSHNFCIRSLTLHTGEITDSSYSMETEQIDSNLYESLMTYLNERGVNNMFADELVEFSTAVENNCYIDSLERLKNFIRR